jgi:hypothetical protein
MFSRRSSSLIVDPFLPISLGIFSSDTLTIALFFPVMETLTLLTPRNLDISSLVLSSAAFARTGSSVSTGTTTTCSPKVYASKSGFWS